MNEVIQNILTRRSCKSYKTDMIPDEIIDEVIEAGLYAASGMGQQSPIIIAVRDKTTRDMLSALNKKYDMRDRPDPFYNAPVVCVVLASKDVFTYLYDGSLVLGNMMLAAHSLGVGSCWIHRAKEMFEEEEGKKLLDRLGIEGDYEGIGNLVLGYPEHIAKDAPPRRENRVYKI